MKKRLFNALLITVSLALLLLLLQVYAKHKIVGILEEKEISHAGVDLNLYTNFLKIKKPQTSFGGSNFCAESIIIKDFSYWKYLTADKSIFEEVEIITPVFTLGNGEEKSKKTKQEQFNSELIIEKLKISDANVQRLKTTSTRQSLKMDIKKIVISDILLDSVTIQNSIPFNYGSYLVLDAKLEVKVNELHDLLISEINARDGRVELKNVQIKPLYDKETFNKHISHAESWYNMNIARVKLDNLQLKSKNDGLLLSNPLMEIEKAHLEIYKDKTFPEIDEKKTLYSEKLRKLKLKVAFDTIDLNNSRIFYSEKTQVGKTAGELSFIDLKGTIQNLTNIKTKGKTKLSAIATFMGAAKITLEHSFHTWNTNNEFSASGRLSALDAAEANKFLEPTGNIQLEGKIERLAFNMLGNEDSAKGDMEFEYHNFSVEIQDKEKTNKKKMLSALVNFFTNTNTSREEVKIANIEVARNKQRSFWNFLWTFVFDGIKKSIL